MYGGWDTYIVYVTINNMFHVIYTLSCPYVSRVFLWKLGFVFTLWVSIYMVVMCSVVVLYFTRTHTSPACLSLLNIEPVSLIIIKIQMVFNNVGLGLSIVSSWLFVLLLCFLSVLLSIFLL